MRKFTRHGRRIAAHAAVALAMSAGVVTGLATPAAANHVSTITVTQAGNDGSDVTLQVDVTYTGANGGGAFDWDTGDGRWASVADGVTGGAYAGDASGSGWFSGGSGRLATYTWSRTQPATNVARTRITYTYARSGVYTVDWAGCCPAVTGSLPVSVAASLPACSDTVDNDGDGQTDHPDDPGCTDANDASEFAECPETFQVAACLIPGPIVLDVEVRNVNVTPDGPPHTVAGYVDRYQFRTGPVTTSLLCVRLEVDSTSPDVCAQAGGTFQERVWVLVPKTTVNEPRPWLGEVVTSATVCKAELVATAFGVGVESAPAYTICEAGTVSG